MPVLDGYCVLVVQRSGLLHCLGEDDGVHRWITGRCSHAPIAAGPYRADGGVALGAPSIVGSRALVPTGSGEIVVVSLDDGAVLSRYDVGAPITSTLSVDEAAGLVFAVTVVGELHALELDQLLGDRPVLGGRSI